MISLRARLPLSLLSILLGLTIFLGYSWSRFVPQSEAATATIFIVNNTNDGGAGSLRQAILNANANPGLDTINFILPQGFVNTISPFSPLPTITDPVIIDGYSQIGTNQNTATDGTNATLLVEISGANSPTGPCFTIDAGGSTIRGLVINRCRTAGIRLTTLGANTISGNFLGTDASGTERRPATNQNAGVEINNSPSNTIGGTTPAARNLISGNSNGVSITNGSTGNVVSGNLIGTDRTGTISVFNSTGVNITAPGNTIGGLTASARNIISGNQGAGVSFSTGATLNVVQGNYIGTNAAGSAELFNSRGVLSLGAASDNLIGGTAAGARNVISGNNVGVFLTSNAVGVNTRVEGNLIGSDAAGTAQIPNGGGLFISETSTGNVIGGTAAGAGNLFAFNFDGVVVDRRAFGNSVLSNSMRSGQRIDLNSDFRVNPNDDGDGDTGGNNLQNYPVITSVSSSGGNTIIGGTLNSTPNSSFRVEFFSNPQLDFDGFGPAQTFIGSTTVNTDANGNATFTANSGSATPSGQFITSTATNNATNDTSEISSGVEVNGPETFQFLVPEFRVREDAGTATIIVQRVNGAGGGSTVSYVVSGALATEGLDLELKFGTLTFAAGETSKTITVNIIDDVLIENEEFGAAFLGNSSPGTVVGTRSFAQLFIDDREQTIFGVTTGNNLIAFERAQPSVLYSKVPVTGAQPGEQIVGIDFRPSNGLLYGIGSFSRLYTINTATGAATEVGSGPFGPTIPGSDIVGIDFDPVAGLIRVVTTTDRNFRLNPDTGAMLGPDTNLAYAGSDPSASANPSVGALAYTNNSAGATSTTLYGIDSTLDTLVRIGSPGGAPTSPNSGQLTTIGPLGIDFFSLNNLDIVAGDKAIATTGVFGISFLFNINLLTGSATQAESGFSDPSIGSAAGLIEGVRAMSVATNGIVGFSSATANVSEGAGKVTLTLNRTGDLSGAASVELVSADGTAVQTSDYNVSFATVFFAPGEASKTVDILITDDGYLESNETFTVGLANPLGGFQVGGITSNTITITENDGVPSATNPIDGAPFFVRQHYVDFLNRAPDASGLAFWTNEITACGANAPCIENKRVHVSAAFFLSIEFQRSGVFVYLTHKAAVGTNYPGPAPVPVLYSRFEHDAQTLQRDLIFGQPNFELTLERNKQMFLADFVGRPQFEVAYPVSLTPTQFVDALIANSGVALLPIQRTNAINQFFGSQTSGNQTARAFALRIIAENPAFAAAESNRTFVTMEYFGYLRRDPDATGFNFWLNKLNSFNGNFINAEMVKAFINSTEYRQRFGAN